MYSSVLLIVMVGTTEVVWAGEPGQQFEGFNLQGYTKDGGKPGQLTETTPIFWTTRSGSQTWMPSPTAKKKSI